MKKPQKKAERLAGRSSSRNHWKIVDQIASLLSQPSLAEWPTFLKNVCGGVGLKIENLYLTLMFGGVQKSSLTEVQTFENVSDGSSFSLPHL